MLITYGIIESQFRRSLMPLSFSFNGRRFMADAFPESNSISRYASGYGVGVGGWG